MTLKVSFYYVSALKAFLFLLHCLDLMIKELTIMFFYLQGIFYQMLTMQINNWIYSQFIKFFWENKCIPFF